MLRPDLELWQVDVFTDQPLAGNPAAVIFGGEEISSETMQAIARETNLSETVFVLPPLTSDADYHARIFTTRREIAFAAHPTLAAAHAVVARSPNSSDVFLRQQSKIGIVTIERQREYSPEKFVLVLPPASFQDTSMTAAEVGAMLGLASDRFSNARFPVVSTGVPWLLAEVTAISDLANIEVDHLRVARATKAVGAAGITVFTLACAEGVAARLRTFAPAEGIFEDPVCGSCHGSIAAHLLQTGVHSGLAAGDRCSFLLEQGHEIYRPGFSEVIAEVTRAGFTLKLRGNCVTVLRGSLYI